MSISFPSRLRYSDTLPPPSLKQYRAKTNYSKAMFIRVFKTVTDHKFHTQGNF